MCFCVGFCALGLLWTRRSIPWGVANGLCLLTRRFIERKGWPHGETRRPRQEYCKDFGVAVAAVVGGGKVFFSFVVVLCAKFFVKCCAQCWARMRVFESVFSRSVQLASEPKAWPTQFLKCTKRRVQKSGGGSAQPVGSQKKKRAQPEHTALNKKSAAAGLGNLRRRWRGGSTRKPRRCAPPPGDTWGEGQARPSVRRPLGGRCNKCCCGDCVW